MRRLGIHQSIQSTRSGFTIVELMMVVGILLFLIATSAIVVRNIGNKAREKATMATIVKINGMIQDRVEAMRKALDSSKNQKQMKSLVGQKYNALVNSFDGKYRGLSRPVVEILVRKDIFRQNLPQYIAENPSVNTAMDNLISAPGTAGNAGSDAGASISSEYLYYILTNHETYGVPPVGEDAFTTTEVADTDGDGLYEFIDGWGKPLRFYRWPTRLIKPGGLPDSTINRDLASIFFEGLSPVSATGFNEADPLNVDADDPQDRLQHENDRTGNLLTPLFNSSGTYTAGEYATMRTFWLPLIVSTGEDGILGLYEPSDEINNGVLAQPILPIVDGIFDNITNHNQRAGGR